MKKVLLSLFITVFLLGMSGTVFAGVDFEYIENEEYMNRITGLYKSENEHWEYAEVKLKLNSDIAYIDDVETVCEKPYILNDTTLAPLRCISEAFGAQVNWNGETQRIQINYIDSIIEMQIGSIVAEINGIAEIMPCAPKLSENGVTMIPVRFLSEKLGAEVYFEKETEEIYIQLVRFVKNVVDNKIASEKFGDSYWGWTIDNNSNFEILKNDISYVCLQGEGGRFYISSSKRNLNDMPNDDLEYLKRYCKRYAENTVCDDIAGLTDDGYEYIELKVLTDVNTFIVRKIYTQDSVHWVCVAMYSDVVDKYEEEYKKYMTSFRIDGEISDDIYDVNVLDEMGCYDYVASDFDLEFKVPTDYEEWYEDTEYLFTKMQGQYSNGDIKVSLYPKTNEYSAKSAIKYDMDIQQKILDSEYSKYSEIFEESTENSKIYYYTQSYMGGTVYDFNRKTMYIEKDGYVYGISVKISKFDDVDNKLLNYIIDSFKINELKLDEGEELILKQVIGLDEVTTASTQNLEVVIPKNMEWLDIDENTIMVMDYDNEVSMNFYVYSSADDSGFLMQDYLDNIKINGRKVLEESEPVVIGAYTGHRSVHVVDDTYITEYKLDIGDKICNITLVTNELFYNKQYRQYAEDIIAGINLR